MRFTVAITTAVAALVAALLVAAGTGAGVAGAATGSASATPTWSTLQPYSSVTIDSATSTETGSLALTTALACPSYGGCVGAALTANSAGTVGAAIMVENGAGQWGQPITSPLPGNAASTTSASELTSVACSSASACVAVGTYAITGGGNEPFAVPLSVSGANVSFGTPEQVSLPSNAATGSSQTAFLGGVSCATSGCTAVGSYETMGSVWTAIIATPGASGSWTATAAPSPTGSTGDNVLDAISCPSSGACEAVGNYANASGDGAMWVDQISAGAPGTAQPVTVTGAVAAAASTPTPSTFLDVRTGLSAVSCPSAGVCTAVGTAEVSTGSSSTGPEAVLLPITAGTPGQSTTLTSGGSVAVANVDGVSCSDAGDCTAVGLALTADATGGAIAASEVNGTWSAPVPLQSSPTALATPDSVTIAEAVACTAPGVCVSGGLTYSAVGSGSTATVTEGSFFAYSAFAPTVTTSSLPAATVGKAYRATLQSSGGTGPASWAVTAGSIPAGLTLNAVTGVISGTPTANGQDGFVVTTTNAGPPSLSSSASLSVTVGPAATVSLAYSKISGHSVLMVFSCSGAKCAGKYKLTGIEHVHGGTPTAVDAKAKKKPAARRTVTLARGSYSINPGAGKAIVVKLNATGLKLLRELHKISGRLTLTPTGSKNAALIKTLKFRS